LHFEAGFRSFLSASHAIRCQGRVSRLLSDDLEGIRHQRFILQLSTGQTRLIAHNIDLAPRIQDLQAGDRIVLKGE
jgi:hypothetical protein